MTFDVEYVISNLTLEEKVKLTSGVDHWHTYAVERLGVPTLRVSDGPNGVRGTRFFNGVPAACIPAPTALGSTWNKELLYQVGELLAQEAKAKSVHAILAPTVNIQRSPLGGRGFESFSEDPLLSGYLAANYIKGIQDHGIAAVIKHFVCNDQEDDRSAVSSIVTDRALREIYLMPFQIAIRESGPRAVMTGYNKLNGVHCSENVRLLQEILRGEWKWRGLVMSDWYGTYSTSEAINAGLDLEMPGPPVWRTKLLQHAILSKKVTVDTLDERVRNVLDLVEFSRNSGIPADLPESTNDSPETSSFLRKLASESVVLLKNDKRVLPLAKNKKVLVIGPNAKLTSYCGGGSAVLRPYYLVSPYEGIVNKVSKQSVAYSLGAYSHKDLPLMTDVVSNSSGQQGFDLKFYDAAPSQLHRTVLEKTTTDQGYVSLNDYFSPHINRNKSVYIDISGKLRVPESGVYDFGISVAGTAKLYVDGQLLIDNTTNQKKGYTFFGAGTLEMISSLELQADRDYDILVEFGSSGTSELLQGVLTDAAEGAINIGFAKKVDCTESIAEAAKLASEYDQVVVFSGLNKDWESEAYDRTNMKLPPNNNELIEAVLAVNPNAVIVLQSGTPVEMPWVDRASTLVYSSYGGNETGNGLADVIFGDVNPSGRLPLTFPLRVQDSPSYLNFGSEAGRVLYGEDVYVGYRHYDTSEKAVLFPFGFGLSYTTFQKNDLNVSVDQDTLRVSVTVTNTGDRAGAEVVQVFISQENPSIRRPAKELKGFTKVFLQPNQSAVVDIDISVNEATSFWNETKGKWASERGRYYVHVPNSGSFLKREFSLSKTAYWNGV